MESLFGAWLINNGVSVTIVALLFLLWLSLRRKISAVIEIADNREDILVHCPENRKEMDRKLQTMRESITYLSEKKLDSGKAYEDFIKVDHFHIVSEKTEQTLEAIRKELSELRNDLRMLFDKVLKK